jgi:hypothetical protein
MVNWRKSAKQGLIGEKNTDLIRLMPFLTEIGRFHWSQGEKVTHFTWFGEPCNIKFVVLNSSSSLHDHERTNIFYCQVSLTTCHQLLLNQIGFL